MDSNHTNINSLLKVMDVASKLKKQREFADQQLNLESVYTEIREKIKAATEVTGEELREEEIEVAMQHYFKGLHRFEKPKKSFSLYFARLYVNRSKIFKILLPIFVLLFCAYLAYMLFNSVRNERIENKEKHISQILEELPEKAEKLVLEIEKQSQESSVVDTSKRLLSELNSFTSLSKHEKAEQKYRELEDVYLKLFLNYEVKIVSDANKKSGIDRFIKDDSGARVSGYYIIVEARDASGNVLPMRIENSETGNVKVVDSWGERVSSVVYNKVKIDKLDNGIVDDNLFATKKSGFLNEVVVFKDKTGRSVEKVSQITEW